MFGFGKKYEFYVCEDTGHVARRKINKPAPKGVSWYGPFSNNNAAMRHYRSIS